MKRRARRAPISGRSAPSVRARRAHPGTHPPPSIRPRPLQIPSSRPSVGTQSPRASGTFSKPRSGTFSTPIDTALLGRVSRFRAMPVGDRRSSDAGRRPPPGELAGAPCGARCCCDAPFRSFGEMPVGDRRSGVVGAEAPTGRTGQRSESGRRVVGAGFALTRDAGRRPALQRCRSEAPTGRTGQRSKPRRPCAGIPRRTQKKPARWRVTRGAAVAAPRGVPADFGRGQMTVR